MAENSTTDNGRRSIGSGRAWLVPLAGACLPFTSFFPPRFQAPARIAIGLAAVVAWVGLTRHRSAPPRTIALLAASDERRRGNTWQLALLGVVAAATTAYLIAAVRVTVITTNDGAYYYGVARHIATTGRFEEPIVWHFLNPPDTIVHVPFDYWGPMTSLLLLPSLALFGAAPTTAFLTMAVFSAATLLAFWYFVCIALPLRYYTTQLLALLLFAFSPALDRFRFQPESTVIAQLFLLVALVAFCQRRLAVAVLGGFGILLTRADGAVLFTLIGAAALAQACRAG